MTRRISHTLNALRILLLVIAGTLTLVPFAWLICAAFKTPGALMASTFLPDPSTWSETLSLNNLRVLWAGDVGLRGPIPFIVYLANSLLLTGAQTLIGLLTGSLAGYALAKHRFPGRGPLMVMMLGSMMLPGMLFLAPIYALMFHLGWLDSYAAILVPAAASAFGVFLFRQAITRLPDELIEAARMDGAGELAIWWGIVMPLIRPMTGAYCLITFLGSWNNFLGPQVYLTSQEQLTLPVILNQYIGVYAQQYGVFLAGTLVAIIPPAILFIILQRDFVSGLTSGAVKG